MEVNPPFGDRRRDHGTGAGNPPAKRLSAEEYALTDLDQHQPPRGSRRSEGLRSYKKRARARSQPPPAHYALSSLFPQTAYTHIEPSRALRARSGSTCLGAQRTARKRERPRKKGSRGFRSQRFRCSRREGGFGLVRVPLGGGLLEASWGLLGASWGTLGGLLEASWELGALGAILG